MAGCKSISGPRSPPQPAQTQYHTEPGVVVKGPNVCWIAVWNELIDPRRPFLAPRTEGGAHPRDGGSIQHWLQPITFGSGHPYRRRAAFSSRRALTIFITSADGSGF